MIRRDIKKGKDGRTKTHIRVVEGYRPGPGLPPKQRTIKSFGYLEDQENPEEFMSMVRTFDQTYRKEVIPIRIEVPSNTRMYTESNRLQNYGYQFLEAIYDQLDIGGFIKKHQESSKFKGDYSPTDIYKFLVLLRILFPDSKRASCQLKNNFYGMRTDFSLQDVYRCLGFCAGFETELQRYLNDKVKTLIGRDLSYAFYDVTNYFFDIDFQDEDEGLRKRGVSKEHRVDPIVAMGLFMDSNGLPVSMSLFPGNTSDTITLCPLMNEIKISYGLGRLVIVADKGINSSKNINEILNNGDGYIFSQILRGKKGQRYHTMLFDPTGYIENSDGTYRYKLFTEDYLGKDKKGNPVTRQQKVLLYWSKEEADIARHKREEKLIKAEQMVKNNAYGIKKGVEEYTCEEVIDSQTGEILKQIKKLRTVDFRKAEEDAMFDGYFCIITSELDFDERKIREVYHGLWRIEQSFRILKSDLYARPVFVWKQEHIRAHFLICFTALLIVRILQHRMGNNVLSTERIAAALNAANCRVLKNGIVHLEDVGGAIAFQKSINAKGERVDRLAYSDKDEIALDYRTIQTTFGTNFYDLYPRQEVFNNFLKNMRRA